MKEQNRNLKPATLCIHAGTHLDSRTGGVNSPIFTSTAYAYPNPANENVYPRYFNVPNQQVIARKLAALEKGQDALVFGSGMAAISTLLVETLVCVPSRTSHRTMTPEERQRAGISDGLVRVSVGIEDIDDLLADFSQALGEGKSEARSN